MVLFLRPIDIGNIALPFLKLKKNPTYEEPSPFENKHLTFSTKTVEEMKIYLRENSEKIVNELDLYISED